MKCSRGFKTKAKVLTERIGYYSYGAYLIHALMLDVAVSITDKTAVAANPTIRAIIAFVLTSASAVLLALLISKTPIGRIVVGIGTKKTQ